MPTHPGGNGYSPGFCPIAAISFRRDSTLDGSAGGRRRIVVCSDSEWLEVSGITTKCTPFATSRLADRRCFPLIRSWTIYSLGNRLRHGLALPQKGEAIAGAILEYRRETFVHVAQIWWFDQKFFVTRNTHYSQPEGHRTLLRFKLSEKNRFATCYGMLRKIIRWSRPLLFWRDSHHSDSDCFSASAAIASLG